MPVAALVAVAMVALSLGLYAGVLDDSLPGERDRAIAETALSAVEDRIAPAGVVRPELVVDGLAAGPAGYETNVTVSWDDQRRSAGPQIPATADNASERVSVRAAPARVVPGRLEVAVWR